jgi:hypothetical protein
MPDLIQFDPCRSWPGFLIAAQDTAWSAKPFGADYALSDSFSLFGEARYFATESPTLEGPGGATLSADCDSIDLLAGIAFRFQAKGAIRAKGERAGGRLGTVAGRPFPALAIAAICAP